MDPSYSPSSSASAVASPVPLGTCLTNIFAAPGELFDQLRPAPARASTWVVPGLLLLLVSWIGTAIIFAQEPIKQQLQEMPEKGLQRQVEKGKLTQDQANQALETAGKISTIFTMAISYAAPVWLAFVTPLWWGFLLWLIGGPMLKGTCHYLKAVEVAGLANMVTVLSAVLRTLIVLVTGNLFAGTNPVMLIPNFDPGLALHSAAMRLDVMTFWYLALCGLGIARVSGVAAGKAIAWTFTFWALITGFWVAFGWVMQHAFGG